MWDILYLKYSFVFAYVVSCQTYLSFKHYSYNNVVIFINVFIFVGALITGIALYVIDSTRYGGVLNLSAWTREKIAKEEEEANKNAEKSVNSICKVPCFHIHTLGIV